MRESHRTATLFVLVECQIGSEIPVLSVLDFG